ncbi:MAG: succinate dehydrogenase assembly factor 2 [Alphaproteobacteria bacterium]
MHNRKKLLYIAQHRGTKEMDLLLGSFAKSHVDQMTDEELAEFASLLEMPDVDLYHLLIVPLAEKAPPNFTIWPKIVAHAQKQ